MKASEESTTCRRTPGGRATATAAPPPATGVPRISSSDRPEMYERYPGISGRTQGEMNDNRPAPNAASSVTFSSMRTTTRPLGGLFHRLQRNEGSLCGSAFHLHVMSFHGRQVLVHEVPLPPFGGI